MPVSEEEVPEVYLTFGGTHSPASKATPTSPLLANYPGDLKSVDAEGTWEDVSLVSRATQPPSQKPPVLWEKFVKSLGCFIPPDNDE